MNELTRYAFVFPPGNCAMTSKVFRFNFNRVCEYKNENKNTTELDTYKKRKPVVNILVTTNEKKNNFNYHKMKSIG